MVGIHGLLARLVDVILIVAGALVASHIRFEDLQQSRLDGAFITFSAAFALVSFPARLTRFVLTVLAAELGREILIKLRRFEWRYWGWAAAWILVYAFYFTERFLASWSAAPFHGGMETFR